MLHREFRFMQLTPAGFLFRIQCLVERYRIVLFFLIGMTFGDTSDKFEGTKRVKPKAAKLAYDPGIVPGYNICNRLRVSLFLRTIRVQKEYLFVFRQIFFANSRTVL